MKNSYGDDDELHYSPRTVPSIIMGMTEIFLDVCILLNKLIFFRPLNGLMYCVHAKCHI